MPRAQTVLVGLAAALALATLARLPAAWETGNALNHVSGAWLALADDLSRGTFYRPLHEPGVGYGGTRFFPLVFALEAALVRAGLPLLAAGYALSAAAAAATVAAAYALLRALGLRRGLAAPFAALALAGFAGQHGASAARGDLLPVALSALGLAAVAAAPRARPGLAVLLFGLAFAAKPTALTAPAAAVVWLALRRERRLALAIAAGTAASVAGVVLATDALSHGRFTAILSACALGGADPADLLRAPARLARQLAIADPSGLVLALAALAAVACGARDLARAARAGEALPPLALPALWLAAAAAGLLVVFGSPGTGANHLAELEVAAAVALGAAAAAAPRREDPWPRRLRPRDRRPADDGPGVAVLLPSPARVAAPAAAVAAAAGLALAGLMLRADLGGASRLEELRAVARALPPGRVLSEDPLLPLVAGERPVVLDAWMLRVASERDPALGRALRAELAGRAYAAVVLFRDVADPAADAWFAAGNLGLDAVGEIRRSYRRAGAVGRYHLYLPRERAPAAPPPAAPAGPKVTTLEDVALPGPPPPAR